MSTVSTITVAGNITRDPELRTTNTGKSVATLAVAVNRRRKRGDDWVDETTFLDAVCWGELAEHAVDSLRKGDRVLVVGHLEQRSYTPREGAQRTVLELVASDVGLSLVRCRAVLERVERRGAVSRGGGYDELEGAAR